MLTLTFRQSRSKRYKEAIRYALFFDDFKQECNFNTLNLSLKEIIEKWEWFNLLYWIVLDWAGTTVKYDGLTYYGHSDKTNIFYAVQEIHTNWINHTTTKLVTTYQRIPEPKSKLLDVNPDELSNEELDHLIEVMSQKKKIKDEYEKKMKQIEKMIREGI